MFTGGKLKFKGKFSKSFRTKEKKVKKALRIKEDKELQK